jgi:hypothetical protein
VRENRCTLFRIMRYIERLTDSGVVWRGLGAVRRPAAV